MDAAEALQGTGPEAAPRLLGAVVTSTLPEGRVSVRLTEVEAYDGEGDPASHAWRGRTPRNAAMFGPAGSVYVYRSHGLHWCVNLVCGPSGTASAVLLRAGEVTLGEDLVRRRRGLPDGPVHLLARGPGNLARALGLTGEHDGTALGQVLEVTLAPEVLPSRSGPRVGVSRGAETPWRFTLDSPTVSAWRPGTKKRQAPVAG